MGVTIFEAFQDGASEIGDADEGAAADCISHEGRGNKVWSLVPSTRVRLSPRCSRRHMPARIARPSRGKAAVVGAKLKEFKLPTTGVISRRSRFMPWATTRGPAISRQLINRLALRHTNSVAKIYSMTKSHVSFSKSRRYNTRR